MAWSTAGQTDTAPASDSPESACYARLVRSGALGGYTLPPPALLQLEVV